MKNEPKKIYLQVGEDCPKDADFNKLVGVSWSDESINDNDLVFINVNEIKSLLEHVELANDVVKKINKLLK